MNYMGSLLVTQLCGQIAKLNAWTFSFHYFLCRRIISCSPKEQASKPPVCLVCPDELIARIS